MKFAFFLFGFSMFCNALSPYNQAVPPLFSVFTKALMASCAVVLIGCALILAERERMSRSPEKTDEPEP